jgi:hypothetical protein
MLKKITTKGTKFKILKGHKASIAENFVTFEINFVGFVVNYS